LLILSFAVSMFATVGIAYAQARDVTTFPFVDAIPKTAGVGQPVLINFGLINYLARDGDGWNVTLSITDPNGRTSTVDRMTWSTGTVGYPFVPDTIGTYTLQCIFDRVYYNSSATAVPSGWYAASKSETIQLVIQEDPKPDYPGHQLPREYWSRPIDAQLREWWSIAGSWVARPPNAYAPFNEAPESAHILWAMPIGDTLGGLSGGDNYQIGFQDGDAYEGKFAGAIIIAGILYYNRDGTYTQASATSANSGAMGVIKGSVPHQKNTIVAVDLHTGKTLWEQSYNFGTDNDARITRGQILTWISLNNRGTFAYLWLTSGTTMIAIDPTTGELVFDMVDVPSGFIYTGPMGEMLKYQLVNYGSSTSPDYHLLQWNSSYVIQKDKLGSADAWGSQTRGVTYNATERGYDINVSISGTITGTVITGFPMDRVIIGSAATDRVVLSAISIKPGDEGRVLFKDVTWKPPAVWQELTFGSQSSWSAVSQEDYVAVFWAKELRINYAFSLENGQFLWESAPQIYADAWDSQGVSTTNYNNAKPSIVYNRLYSASCGGIVYCYDITNGAILWTYDAVDKYTESYLTENWWLLQQFISDGKLYVAHYEHSAQEPKPRGAPFFALDAFTGEVVWEIDGAFRQSMWGGPAIIGDSIIAAMDTYDQRIYAIGKGPSSMTVSAPDVGVAVNKPMTIKGTITDVSPGTQSDILQMRFPNGVPVVSDDSMSEWMLYVYKQFERPYNTKGVPISIDAIDPNGNYVSLGTTVSDANGRFSFSFTPDKEGQYTIYAIFEGSNSYYPTIAQNEMTVVAKESSTDPIMYIVGIGIAIIITIIVVVALFSLLILKKIKK
jgi:hypothetical protein